MVEGNLNAQADLTAPPNTLPPQTPVTPTVPPEAVKPNPFIKIFLVLFLLIGLGGAGFWLWQTYGQNLNLKFLPSAEPAITTPKIPASPATITQSEQYQSVSDLSQAHNALGFDLIQSLAGDTEDKDKNIFISPASIALALSMTYNGAAGETQEAMAKTLHIKGLSLVDLNQSSLNLINRLKNPDPQVEMAIANSIWARKGITFKPEFIATDKQFYEAQVENLDFSLPEAADIINAWVAKNTREKIPTIVKKPIDPMVVMYLINAIYFKGSWTSSFDPKLTTNMNFNLTNQQKISHPFMKQTKDDFQYLENDDFQAIYLPYGKNKKLGMYVFLPKRDLAKFITQMTAANWQAWQKQFKSMEGTLLLPKFKIDYDKELKGILSSLGMGLAFSDNADFSNMWPEKDINIKISKVKHKTYIDVNEEGTEAAAVTSIEMTFGAVGPTQPKKVFYMEVNKPFFLAITDAETGEMLFSGLIRQPQK